MKVYRFPNKDHDVRLLQQVMHQNADARFLHRCHIVLFVIQFQNVTNASLFFDEPTRTIQTWVSDYLQDGIVGLQDKIHPGKPSRLTSQQKEELKTDLQTNPMFVYNQVCWDGKLLSHHIMKKYQIQIQVRQCQRLMHQLGFTLQRPRPICNGDKAKQEEFKKKPKNSNPD